LSRFVNYHLFIAVLFAFRSAIFNAIVIACFPVMILTTVWDINFYKQFRTRNYWTKNRGWLVVERLTLHPPILIVGGWIYVTGILNPLGFARFLFPEVGLFAIAIAMPLVYVPFFLWDNRWVRRYNWPQAPIMITIMSCANLALILIGIFGAYQMQL
jgi:hypothetical protein